ncbi:MAG TPA: fumarylacetoacetate hydrolase family protein [Mycobacteriales bacterium]|nr:fumarylacetoacetate hydrolase family protein [Mycobacteriales bacterium]
MTEGYGDTNLPYAVAVSRRWSGTRVVSRYGDRVVELAALADAGVLPREPWWTAPSLNAFLASGPDVWRAVRQRLGEVVGDAGSPDAATRARVGPAFHPVEDVQLVLPVEVADYVDFYASEHHATNLGRILRPGQEPLPTNWRHLPAGYHGRSGTVVVSGTPVVRPNGQRRPDADAPPVFGPSERLDVEVEVGFVVGVGSSPGRPVAVDAFADHVFGVVLVNDWSARDIQAWEFAPLGPFLGKSFATSISPWVVPLDALAAARLPVASSGADHLLPYLRESEPWGLDIDLELWVNGEVVSRPPYASMYWSPAQMLAHLTGNGARLRTGDLYASGTVSGAAPDQVGSLIERWGNERFLADGDEVVIAATAPAVGGGRIGLGDVRGRVLPAGG